MSSSSTPAAGEIGVTPPDAGSGIWVADRTGASDGVGRGRPKPACIGVGRDDEWIGFVGMDDLRCDSVKSVISDVSSCACKLWPPELCSPWLRF